MRNMLGLAGCVVALLLMSAPQASAQPSQPPPPPPPPGGGGPGGAGPGSAVPIGQPPPPQNATGPLGFFGRRGIYGGIGLGFGGLTASCDGCDEIYYGPGLHFNIGWQLTPNLGIFLDGGGLGVDPDTDGQATLVQAVVAVGVQYWIQQPIWLKAGIGSAQLSIYSDFLEDETETVFGLLLAAGYEIVSQPGFSVDAEFRIATGFYDEVDGSSVTNFGVQFSVNWHSLFQPFIVIR